MAVLRARPERACVAPGPYEVRLAEKYGVSVAEAKVMIGRMVQTSGESGLPLRFDVARPGNTFDAHRLLHLARREAAHVRDTGTVHPPRS